MRVLILAAVVLVSTFYVAKSQYLPEVLIHRARNLIQRAEYDLHQHHQHGRSHLTQELIHEIELVRDLVKELEALESTRNMEREEVHRIEERLLNHENQLSEITARIEQTHNIEIDEGRRAHENRNREDGEDGLLGGF